MEKTAPKQSATGTGTLHDTRARLWRTTWITAIAAVYVAYLGLLITCDFLSVTIAGFIPRFENGLVTVSSLLPQSLEARAGLESGDRIVRANGQVQLPARVEGDRAAGPVVLDRHEAVGA